MHASSRLSFAGLACALAIALGAAPVAYAQKPPDDANALFARGRDLAKAGKLADACAAFEQSQKLDPAFGTLYNLAGCYADLGKLASALATYRDLAAHDTNAARRDDSARRAKALEPRVGKLAITVAPRPAGVTVTSNGADVTAQLDAPAPVDAGSYALVAHAPGYVDAQATATVGGAATDEGKTVAVTIKLVPKAEPAPQTTATPTTLPTTTATMSPASPPPAPEAPSPADTANPGHGRRILAIAVGGTGIALVAGGLAFGKLASSKLDAAKSICPDLACADQGDLAAAKSDTDAAGLRGNLSTAFVVAGAAAVAGGVVLWLTAPSAEPTAPTARLVPHASPSDIGLALEGRF